MIPSTRWIVAGVVCLVAGLCSTEPAGADPIILTHSASVHQDLALRLPVHMVRHMSQQPAEGGEILQTVSFPLDYTGGPVTLAADAAGTRQTMVDDQLTMRVTHPDGTTSQYQDEPTAAWHDPMDLSKHFRVGVNKVEMELRDRCGDVMWCTDLWLTGSPPKSAELPLALFQGEQPQSYWPSQEMVVSVNGPERDWDVVLSGDEQGLTGTWAACEIEIRVTRADGSVCSISYDYSPTGGTPRVWPPVDVTFLFAPGTNRVEAYIRNDRGGPVASSPVWLALVRRP